MPSEIERFEPFILWAEDGSPYIDMVSAGYGVTGSGDYVRYSDHIAALASLPDRTGEALTELERALCEFTNAASDQYDPSEWIPETKRNFEALCEAYNKAYTAGCFPVPAALRTSSTGGKG